MENLARKYDTVEAHGWYENLDPTLDEMAAVVSPGDLIIDYSGGTGILIDRFLARRDTPDDLGFVSGPRFRTSNGWPDTTSCVAKTSCQFGPSTTTSST